MTRQIVIDAGKDDTKIVLRNMDGTITHRKMPTRVSVANEISAINKQLDNGITIVKYEDKTYVVGDPEGSTTDSNSKMDDIHKIMTLTAIATTVEVGDTVQVAIGCPLATYSDKDARDEYLDFILPMGLVEIIVDGQSKRFYIADRMCFAESLGAVLMYPEYFTGTVGVIDIGGLNVNASYYINGKLLTDNCFTEKYGKLHITRKLRSTLNQKFDAQFSEPEVEVVIRQGYVTNAEEESIPLIEQAYIRNLNDIESACKNNGWNMSFCKLIYIGGTSAMLKSQIQDKYPKAFIPDDSEYVNADGFMRGLCIKLKL